MKSVSNNDTYPTVCKQASEEGKSFDIFKTIPAYTQILEHTSIEFGWGYYDVIKREHPELLEDPYISKFQENDLYGGAKTYLYDKLLISPSTLRYIKVLSDLITHFGDLAAFKIVEIGGGYGGQCKIICDFFDIKDYHMVDIAEANCLAATYLKRLKVKNVRFSTHHELTPENYDLVISNYAYTELDRHLQDWYKQCLIDTALNGYLICNFIVNYGQFETYSREELLRLNQNFMVFPEEPLTCPTNFIGIWKNTQ